MTDSSSWWARKLAAQQGAPAAAPQYPRTGPTPPPAPLPQATQQQQVGQVTAENLMDAASQWKGGKATKTETANCPDCGSANFFSNRNGESTGGAGATLYTQAGALPVAPRCFECGFTTAHGKQTGAMG